MADTDIRKRLDDLCGRTNSATVRNSLHACRSDHPLNGADGNPWSNAWALCAQRPYTYHASDLEWLLDQSVTWLILPPYQAFDPGFADQLAQWAVEGAAPTYGGDA